MTIFIVNGQEKVLRYDVNGIDVSRDFIGNTYHGMETDEEGRYLATQEDFEWWQEVIAAHQKLDETIARYKERFGDEEVDNIVWAWAGNDYDTHPGSVTLGLEKNFGKL